MDVVNMMQLSVNSDLKLSKYYVHVHIVFQVYCENILNQQTKCPLIEPCELF